MYVEFSVQKAGMHVEARHAEKDHAMIVMLHFAACSTLGCIHTDEGPPSRPPLALLLVIAHRVAGLDVVDLRPSTDVASCLVLQLRSGR